MQLVEPMGGCRVVIADGRTVVFGQPPEVIKSLARANVNRIDTLVLPDSRMRGGVLLSTALSSLPAWQFIDPLPVLARTRDGEEGGGEERLDEIEENPGPGP